MKQIMRDEYDFSKAKRGAVIPSPGKTRITIMLDDDVIEHFRAQAEAQGVGYQTSINALLRRAMTTASTSPSTKREPKALTVATLRRVLREELHLS
jgi:predicted DNA binding CopG/RHH family protein